MNPIIGFIFPDARPSAVIEVNEGVHE